MIIFNSTLILSIGIQMLLAEIVALDNDYGRADEQALFTMLQSRLPRYSPPKNLTSVYVAMQLMQILDINEQQGLWTVKLWLTHFYSPVGMYWEKDAYNGTNTLSVPKNTFWSPDISK